MTSLRLTRSQDQIASRLIALLISLIGLTAFFYPFFLSALPSDATANVRAGDAPVIFGILMPLLLLLIVAELSSQRMNAKIVAALGVLTAINAILRLPTGFGDSPTFFFLPMLLGYAYGARFGFLHGTLSLFVSALLTVGIGPWLPFQMLAMGWIGMGA
ncbi:MAG: ECF transporter S component, partial [Chloroflexi bacterium]|nr:ECF transporter S component [Chloroflexota bacterium]